MLTDTHPPTLWVKCCHEPYAGFGLARRLRSTVVSWTVLDRGKGIALVADQATGRPPVDGAVWRPETSITAGLGLFRSTPTALETLGQNIVAVAFRQSATWVADQIPFATATPSTQPSTDARSVRRPS